MEPEGNELHKEVGLSFETMPTVKLQLSLSHTHEAPGAAQAAVTAGRAAL